MEYVDIKTLSRTLRTQFIEYSHTLQDFIPDSLDESLSQIIILYELLDAVEDHTPFSMETIKEEVRAWQSCRNGKKAIINWRFTTKDAPIK